MAGATGEIKKNLSVLEFLFKLLTNIFKDMAELLRS